MIDDGRVIPCGLVVWSTGLAPRPMTAALKVEKNSRGQILVDNYLNIHSDPSKDSYAIGDCASIIDSPFPCTAQVLLFSFISFETLLSSVKNAFYSAV